MLVSIHAPARGATRNKGRRGQRAAKFQSTRPHGARLRYMMCCPHRQQFQSTRPHGARRAAVAHAIATRRCFNPRARTGRDLLALTLRK